MELDTPRLRLRLWRPQDRAPFFAINTEPEVLRYLPPVTRAGSDAMLDRYEAHFAQHGFGYWALEDKDSTALIGCCGLMHVPFEAFFTPAVEIGWRLSATWQGKGFATEAGRAVLEHAFGPMRLNRVTSFTSLLNTPSLRVMGRLGMTRIGEFDHPFLAEGHSLRPHVAYEITPKEARKT
jgi:RimJ/RimL family protein N-acetyltransferase